MTDGGFEWSTSGWFIALAAATWGIVLRVLVGRREASARRQEARFEKIETDVANIKESLASIAGRLIERDRYGRYTWPGDEK
jgi:Na+/glutamate symporter